MMLYFGSFNPVHKGHIALAEWVVEHDLCDEVALIVSPQNPHKEAATLVPELERFEMAEIACKASAHPDRIRPSVIEILLPKPSYTIDTLRHLTENYGNDMEFSILMGSDQLERLGGWKESDKILEYPIYVYPRGGAVIPAELTDRITLLKDAPLLDISATEVRRRIESGEDTADLLHPDVATHIRQKGLWSPASHWQSSQLNCPRGPTTSVCCSNTASCTTGSTNGVRHSMISTVFCKSTLTTSKPGNSLI